MRVVIDACVLYPTVLRQIVLGVAARGLFTPLWSARILEEWARATRKLGPVAESVARAEVAALRLAFPDAETAGAGSPASSLPDPDDDHVLATAIAAEADLILTLNLRDFPARLLAPHGISARDPDRFLIGLARDHPKAVAGECTTARDQIERLSGLPQPLLPLLKRAGLPRLGKLLVHDDS